MNVAAEGTGVVVDRVLCGPALDLLGALPAGAADLVYLDPPFNTGRRMAAANGAYVDSWPDLPAYLSFLRAAIVEIRRVLKATGSILLHCDWRTSHHLRLMLDGVFGEENFVNHLVWSYGLGGSSARRFARKHDDILFYGRSGEYWFDPPRVPATSHRMRGQFKKATDVLAIPAINNMALERVGYPTQKPLALLELLIAACSPRGGLVIDPFCGSGTALVAARRLGRRYLGTDVNPDAVHLAQQRLGAAGPHALTGVRRRSRGVGGRGGAMPQTLFGRGTSRS
jgi:DNA modification methylase